MKKSADQKVNEEVLSSQITRNLQIVDDFVWVNNTEPEITSSTNLSERDLQVATNIAQCDPNINNMYLRHQYDEDDGSISDPDRQNSIEDLYWEQSRTGQDKFKSQLKLQTSNRKTVKECIMIANNKMIPRHPSFYKFDAHTCHILETIPYKLGPLTNILGKGNNSIVIYAESSPSNWIYFPKGCAVKVYKLGSDVKKNAAIFKRVRREEEHLRCFSKCSSPVPYVLYRSKNVIVTSFFGYDQETAPSIDSISGNDYLAMYQEIVEEIDKWYNKTEIVHGNLSTRNIVYFYNGIGYIGWSHSVRRKHPLALTKLMKDCLFVTNFFRTKGVGVKPTEELFKEITGLKKISSKVLEVLSKKDLWKDLHPNNPNRMSENSARPSRNSRFKNGEL